jgi:hypothetical protein
MTEPQASRSLSDYLHEDIASLVEPRTLDAVCAKAEGAYQRWAIDLAGKEMLAEAEADADPCNLRKPPDGAAARG